MTSLPRKDLHKYGTRVREIHPWPCSNAQVSDLCWRGREWRVCKLYRILFTVPYFLFYTPHEILLWVVVADETLLSPLVGPKGFDYGNFFFLCWWPGLGATRLHFHWAFLGLWMTTSALQCLFPIIRYQRGSLTKILWPPWHFGPNLLWTISFKWACTMWADRKKKKKIPLQYL